MSNINQDGVAHSIANPETLSVWKTVKVGNLGSVYAAIKQLKVAGIKINVRGENVLEQVTFRYTKAFLI